MSQKEANIIVNGRQLSEAESMTVRVALNSFSQEVNQGGLGDDEHGKKMVELYTANANSVLNTIHTN